MKSSDSKSSKELGKYSRINMEVKKKWNASNTNDISNTICMEHPRLFRTRYNSILLNDCGGELLSRCKDLSLMSANEREDGNLQRIVELAKLILDVSIAAALCHMLRLTMRCNRADIVIAYTTYNCTMEV